MFVIQKSDFAIPALKSTSSAKRVLGGLCVLTLVIFHGGNVQAATHKPDSSEIVETAQDTYHHVIFENEDIRLMRVIIPPHGKTRWHRQSLDYVNTPIVGTTIHTDSLSEPSKDGTMKAGEVRYLPYSQKSDVDQVINTGDTVNSQVTFEIKRKGVGHFGPADRANSQAFRMILDKPVVRGWHVHLEPGQSTGDYTQSGPGVRVFLIGGRLMTREKGAVAFSEQHLNQADAQVLAKGTFEVINGGMEPLDYNEYELR